MTETSPPTLDDVARAAGVSTATVSRCLNKSQKVNDATKQRVMEAVDRLGYTPNFNARALAAKRSYTIGAIIPTMENAIFARGLQAFQEHLNANGYTLLVSSTAYNLEREAEQIRTLVARGADALLLIGYERDQASYDFLAARQVPYLVSWVYRPGEMHPAVGFDNRQAIVELTDAVLALGHRDIAIISGVRAGNDRAADRVMGIREALGLAGLPPSSVPMIETPYSIENGGDAFESLMRNSPRPTVVMCTNDVLAVGAMQRARAMGLRVPEDVSVTGFDDIELARLVTPTLTTVHVPHGKMGARAARELIALTENKGGRVSFRLESSLCLRDSLAAPKPD